MAATVHITSSLWAFHQKLFWFTVLHLSRSPSHSCSEKLQKSSSQASDKPQYPEEQSVKEGVDVSLSLC